MLCNIMSISISHVICLSDKFWPANQLTYVIWNLDFFQYFIPAFCISSDMSTLYKLALEYIVAVYPLLLTLVIYVCIEMYDRGVRVVVVCGGHFMCASIASEGGGIPKVL